MGVDVTAEGVETAEQRDVLKRIGCDELQGFLLSPPGRRKPRSTQLLGVGDRRPSSRRSRDRHAPP